MTPGAGGGSSGQVLSSPDAHSCVGCRAWPPRPCAVSQRHSLWCSSSGAHRHGEVSSKSVLPSMRVLGLWHDLSELWWRDWPAGAAGWGLWLPRGPSCGGLRLSCLLFKVVAWNTLRCHRHMGGPAPAHWTGASCALLSQFSSQSSLSTRAGLEMQRSWNRLGRGFPRETGAPRFCRWFSETCEDHVDVL